MSSLLRAFNGAGGLYASAIDYYDAGISIIPCRIDKRPALPSWSEYQERRAGIYQLDRWFAKTPHFRTRECGQGHQSIGVVCGRISQNIVVIDLDGVNAVKAFYAQFPKASGATLTVKTGSQNGVHLYFQVDRIPDNMNVRVAGIGGFEIRGNGQYVIAPPSPHPSGNQYQAVALRPIAHVPNLDRVCEWFESMRETEDQQRSREIAEAAKPVSVATATWKHHYLQNVVSQELARIETATEGNRNNSLFNATLRLANFCAGGELSRYDMEARLLTTARKANIPAKEAERTIASGFNIGWKYPKQVPLPKVES